MAPARPPSVASFLGGDPSGWRKGVAGLSCGPRKKHRLCTPAYQHRCTATSSPCDVVCVWVSSRRVGCRPCHTLTCDGLHPLRQPLLHPPPTRPGVALLRGASQQVERLRPGLLGKYTRPSITCCAASGAPPAQPTRSETSPPPRSGVGGDTGAPGHSCVEGDPSIAQRWGCGEQRQV